MKNLAGVNPTISTPIVIGELVLAGAKVLTTEFRKSHTPEVKAPIVGVLTFADGTVVAFSRQWYYWSVSMTKMLPASVAAHFNDTWRREVRVDGYAGGTSVSHDGCGSYHVDTQTGLNALVQLLKSNFGELADESPTVEKLAKLRLINDAIFG